jgi:hypothetical protein
MRAEKISRQARHDIDTRTTYLMLALANLVLVSVGLGIDVVECMVNRSGKLARDLGRLLLLELERILRALREEF